ncbi:MAG: anaerobic ribonucleoside-triphosphate reductase, partial [Thermoprotei archaeon]
MRPKRVEEAYIKKTDWEIRENANTTISFSDFLGYLLSRLLKTPDVLRSYLPEKSVKLHFARDIHIHKLPYSLWVPYCAGWSYAKLLRLGLITPTLRSKPAKHLSTAISHLINFFHLTAQEWTGAQAISAIDLYTAPFIRHDKLDYRTVKQEFQKMFFELNYPTRLGYQSAFTNATLMLEA